MDSNSKNSSTQGIRDHARHEHWKKFDTIIGTLIAMDASPTDLEERLRAGKKYLKADPLMSFTKCIWHSLGRKTGSGRNHRPN